MENNRLLIGIDGGATKVSGWIVDFDSRSGRFVLSDENVQKSYREYKEFIPDYTPVDIKSQLAEMSGPVITEGAEKQQGQVYSRCAADVIIELLERYPDRRALVGIGMPGLKSADRRGIVALANGPRIPDYSDAIEAAVEKAGLRLESPIHHLGSDADYCGFGEEYSDLGFFSDVDNAYYLGGGTGVADALKLKGKVVPFDNIKPWMAKAWEMKGTDDLSMERYGSAGGIQHVYSLKSGIPVAELNDKNIYPPTILQRAVNGETAAVACMNAVADNIADLLFERMNTVFAGSDGTIGFMNPARATLEREHPSKGTLLDRIILGQRLGDLMKEAADTAVLWKPMILRLTSLIAANADSSFIEHYLPDGALDQELIHFSRLREAPAIGAAVDAWISAGNIL